MQSITIDEEFKNCLPPLDPQEREGLEQRILEDGQINQKLITWKGILIDGHNRYEIAQKHNLPFETIENTTLETRSDVLNWIIRTQIDRRNLTDNAKKYYRGKAYSSLKKRHGAEKGGRGNQYLNKEVVKSQVATLPKSNIQTAERLAKKEGVDRATIYREQNFAKNIDAIDAIQPGFAAKALANPRNIPAVALTKAAEIAPENPDLALKIVEGDMTQDDIVKAAKVIQRKKTDKIREKRIEKIAQISQGNKPLDALLDSYPVIYCDPPWRYEHIETESRAIENQYPTMSLDEIKALSIPAGDDCVLFMWATSPKLQEAMSVLDAWGFTYKTCAVWDKQKMGMGYYFRQQHELLLVATKGKPPAPKPEHRPRSIFSYPRGEHSAKPHEVYTIIEEMYSGLPMLELFCRTPREGWATWGNQS